LSGSAGIPLEKKGLNKRMDFVFRYANAGVYNLTDKVNLLGG